MRAEPIDLDGLRLVERWLAADPVGGAIFGGFYGQAVSRWAPLLEASTRHGWITADDEGPVGFIDLEILDGEVELVYYVDPARRGQGLGVPTVALLVELAAGNGARIIHAAVEPTNLASLACLRASGFADVGVNEFDELELARAVHA